MPENLMHRYALILAFLAALCIAAVVQTGWLGRGTAVRLEIGDVVCSGTVVGPHTIASAQHCFEGHGDLSKIDDRPAAVVAIIKDGADHVLVVTNITFKTWAKFGPDPYSGERIHLWGEVAGLHYMFRSGYVSGQEAGVWLADINAYHGDSGAGLLDDQGRLVGIDSGGGTWQESGDANTFHLAYFNPLAFTAAQYKAIR